jgi:hypothetical protein
MRWSVSVLASGRIGVGFVELRVVALADEDEDAGESAAWAVRLVAELSDLDDVWVETLVEDAPEGSKGLGAVAGAVLARLASVTALKAVLETVGAWVARTGRTVEVSVDGDVLKLTGASRQQQDRIVEAWIVRHAPGA